jgi:hypothetical protein
LKKVARRIKNLSCCDGFKKTQNCKTKAKQIVPGKNYFQGFCQAKRLHLISLAENFNDF